MDAVRADEHSTRQWNPSQPRDRTDFEVAIICALPLEASAVSALFDRRWDDQNYGKAPTDSNAYSTGVIGHHNVVLVHMSNMGKVNSATAAADLHASFQGIKLALMVGICGGVPFGRHLGEGILLGDVVISEGLVQYDFGRQFPNNRFERKDTVLDNVPRPTPKIRAALAKLQTEQGQDWLQNGTSKHLGELRQRLSSMITYPGATEDRLFRSTYPHKHHEPSECAICAKGDGRGNICDEAVVMSCEELKCCDQELVRDRRLSRPYNPVVHFGLIASGDTVMKSGEDRDGIATRDRIIAFEMEGAGVWEKFPGSLVIKGICDYADSHKSKKWQNYAAATAAAVTKAFLENWNIGMQFQRVIFAEIEVSSKYMLRKISQIFQHGRPPASKPERYRKTQLEERKK
jgi:nucleoside phosphorylase